MKILVLDIGGTNLKMLATGEAEPRKVPSGPTLTPDEMVRLVQEQTADWEYEAVSIGYPGFVYRGKPVCEPANLGEGWVGFDFAHALGRPVKVINDAAMQALGSYEGGRMLFLGLGTGLGSALIVEGLLEPMELAHLPYRKGKTFEDYLGQRGMDRLGKKKWREHVADVVERLKKPLDAEYVVLGGGNARHLKELPQDAKLGDNRNAFVGGFRLWEEIPTRRKKPAAASQDR
jgi:predicted NBD/HSP70 family sugar kinase